MRNIKGEVMIAIGMLVLLFVLFNPWSLFMPGYVAMSLLVAITALFIIFAAFLWKESDGDERENFHRLFADRMAYLTGSGVLILAMVAGELAHVIDPWLIFALAAMIVAKVLALIYTKIKL